MRRPFRFAAIAALVGCGLTARPAAAQTTYTWNDTATAWTSASAWTPAGPDWTSAARLADALAAFGNEGTITNAPTIGAATVFARGLSFDNTGADWSLTGTTGVLGVGTGGLTWTGGGASTVSANLRVVTDQTWDVGTTTVTHTGALSGYGALTKAGSGSLILDTLNTTFTGSLAITTGTVQVGGTTTAALLALRNTAVTLSPGTTLVAGGATTARHLRVGAITGTGGTVNTNVSTGVLVQSLTSGGAFAGTVVAGGLSVSGPDTQTYTGDLTGVGGTLTASGRAVVVLAGTGSTTGVIGSTIVHLRGGTVVLDNSGGNTAAAAGRVGNSTAVYGLGGTFRLLGDPAGTSESAGELWNQSGHSTIDVVHN
ncbi:MAG: hypothetical protein LC708_03865, partial [Actinobacteria bacterium]|nr:hypothetical protein [Actinomycetota bacterium]